MKILNLFLVFAISLCLASCGTQTKKEADNTQNKEEVSAQPEKPSDADLMAFKVYHHMVYMVTTAKQAGGTNKLLHTKELPTEGTDPVVSPALDHIYSKVVVDLTEGPVTVEYPEITDGRYYSINITDQEHYTNYDEIHPKVNYTIFLKVK
jgi:hypothetical protein